MRDCSLHPSSRFPPSPSAKVGSKPLVLWGKIPNSSGEEVEIHLCQEPTHRKRRTRVFACGRVSCGPCWPQTHCLAKDDFELQLLWPDSQTLSHHPCLTVLLRWNPRLPPARQVLYQLSHTHPQPFILSSTNTYFEIAGEERTSWLPSHWWHPSTCPDLKSWLVSCQLERLRKLNMPERVVCLRHDEANRQTETFEGLERELSW